VVFILGAKLITMYKNKGRCERDECLIAYDICLSMTENEERSRKQLGYRRSRKCTPLDEKENRILGHARRFTGFR
jgi:hypothetical protein